jgi:hypothetical protein
MVIATVKPKFPFCNWLFAWSRISWNTVSFYFIKLMSLWY